jgi:hypothetical protein
LYINLKKLHLVIPWDPQDYSIQTSKFSFWGVVFTMNFFTLIYMKIRWYLIFLDLLYTTSKSSWAFMVQISTLDL